MLRIIRIQFSSVAQSCLNLYHPMDCSTLSSLSIPNTWSLLRLKSTESVMPPHPMLCRPLLLPPSIFPSIRVFLNESVLCIRWPKYWVSASASVLPMNIQDWFSLWWTGWISLQSKGRSRVFNTTVQKQLFCLSFLYSPNLTSIHDYWKNHSPD